MDHIIQEFTIMMMKSIYIQADTWITIVNYLCINGAYAYCNNVKVI